MLVHRIWTGIRTSQEESAPPARESWNMVSPARARAITAGPTWNTGAMSHPQMSKVAAVAIGAFICFPAVMASRKAARPSRACSSTTPEGPTACQARKRARS